MKTKLLFLFAAALFLGACNNKPATGDNANMAGATGNTGSMADTSGKMNNPAPATAESVNDTQFLATAYNIGVFEIKISRLAGRKSQDKKVKEFAAMIISDHTAMDKDILALLDKEKYPVPAELPADLMDKDKELSKLAGAEFDKKYATINVEGHKGAAIALFTRVSSGSTDADVRQLATSDLPMLQKHEDHAQKLLAGINTP